MKLSEIIDERIRKHASAKKELIASIKEDLKRRK